MLSGLPKLLDKNFVVGFLLPTILGLVLFAWLLPGVALLAPLRSLGSSEKALGDLTYLILLSYGIALVLMMTNTLQYRLVEGYVGPIARWGRGRQRHEAIRSRLDAELKALDARAKGAGAPLTPADRALGDRLNLQLVNDYPPLDQAAMPTRFGNAIRAFESYPLQVYGADGPPVWLRLASVVPEKFAGEVDDARGRVNFLLNLLFILVLFSIAALARAATATPWLAVGEALRAGEAGGLRVHPALIAALAALLLVFPLYAFAINQAKAWGELVKAAFDCYLPDLAKQLGYAVPTTATGRGGFWGEINALIVYRQAADPRLAPLAGTHAPPAPRLLPPLIR